MMKIILPLKNINYKARLFLVLILSIPIVDFAKANVSKAGSIPALHDSILVKVSFTRISGKIKLYSNCTSEALFFTALGDERKLYQLFLFDMSGKLVSQTRIRDSETALLSRFEKGNYMFEVFNDDDRIENGSIVVK